MKIFFRILLFSLCITTIFPLTSFATEPALLSASEDYELLDKTYVQLELSKDNSTSISIIKSINSIIKIIQSNYYSLLNWRIYSRNSQLKIENYDRKLQFGRWINDPYDETCFNTRAMVLLRDSEREVVFKDTNHCMIDSGRWNDPYTGQNYKAATDIQIDHFVPLKNAYLSGAYKWNFKTRCLYANYLGSNYHLLSVNSTENMRKGDRGPEKYIPPNPEYTCTYIKNWLSIKFLWGLRMTPSEAEAVATAIKNNNCDPRKFRISDYEILRQSKFYQSTIDLCEKLDAASKTAAN